MRTSAQIQKLDALYANGQVEGITNVRLESFSDEEVELLISECEAIPPHTFQPIPAAMRDELLLLIRNGVLQRVSEADLRYMTVHTGETLLWSVTSNDINREELASNAQYRRVKKLLAEGFLSGGSVKQIRSLTKHLAEKLIREGEENARNGMRSESKYN